MLRCRPASARPVTLARRSLSFASTSTSGSHPPHPRARSHQARALGAVSLLLGAAVALTHQSVHSDAPSSLPELPGPPSVVPGTRGPASAEDTEDHISTLAWGSNRAHLILPNDQLDAIRTPSPVSWLKDVALRDLVVHEKHAACVDPRGNVYQWGDSFSAGTDPHRKPKLTLASKNIVSLQLTADRLFALSSSGHIYVLPSNAASQALKPGVPTPSTSPWWGTGWIWGEYQSTDYAEIKADSLSRGEKFVSISAGRDHMLALTSAGRTFGYPITMQANTHGQLGLRKFDIPNPTTAISPSSSRISIDLVPKALLDPHALDTPFRRRGTRTSTDEASEEARQVVNDDSIRFCDKLFEVPALKGIKVAQAVVGARSSFVRTDNGKVLAWGANEYGQLGLGANMTVTTISIPTEVILAQSPRSSARCTNIATGGDLTLFTVERADGSSIPSVDVLSCGMGQWGGLGNGLFSNAQRNPVKVKNVSGLVEFSEKHGNLQAIPPHAMAVSPSGHVLLTLDTLTRTGPGVRGAGRDLLGWGVNQDYQLGNGKRSSVAVPLNVVAGDASERLILAQRKTPAVLDMEGNVWKRRVLVEQVAVAGPSTSFVYWKIVQ